MFTVLLSDHFLHVSVLIIIYSFTEQNDCGCGLSLEPRLSIPDFVWNESLGSRLVWTVQGMW